MRAAPSDPPATSVTASARPRPDRWSRVLLGAVAASGLAAALSCVVNPASGRQDLMTISESQEIEIGREAAGRIEAQEGLYETKPDLVHYVASVGSKLAARSDRPASEYRFAIVDTPDVNAFALLGGFVFVTRGLLVTINSEDELAAVLGHEIAHVAARHGAAQLSRAQAGQAGTGLASAADPHRAAQLGPFVDLTLQLAFQGHSREDEREADDLGVKYAKRAGYSSEGAVALMETLARLDKNQPGRLEGWFASHPTTAERTANVAREARALREGSPKASSQPLRREPYLRAIEGVTIGWVGPSGYIAGKRYVSKRHDYSLQVPEGWSARLKGEGIVMTRSPEGFRADLQVRPTFTPGGAPMIAREYSQSGAAAEGLQVAGPMSRATLPAGEAVIVELRGQDPRSGPIFVRKMFLARFDRAYILTMITPANDAEEVHKTFMNLTGSIQFLNPAEMQDFLEPRLTLYTTRAGDTWNSVAEGQVAPGVRGEQLAAFNGRDERSEPQPGLAVKIPPASFFQSPP